MANTRLHHIMLLALLASAACQGTSGSITMKEIATYPHIANSEQTAKIKNGYRQVANGMLLSEVVAILGEPDEIRPLYEPNIKSGKLIGYTHWYVIRRLEKSGSFDKKGESVVRVSYDLVNRVTTIDHWGLDRVGRNE